MPCRMLIGCQGHAALLAWIAVMKCKALGRTKANEETEQTLTKVPNSVCGLLNL